MPNKDKDEWVGVKVVEKLYGFKLLFKRATLEEAKKFIADLNSDEKIIEINEAWWERIVNNKIENTVLVPWKGPCY